MTELCERCKHPHSGACDECECESVVSKTAGILILLEEAHLVLDQIAHLLRKGASHETDPQR